MTHYAEGTVKTRIPHVRFDDADRPFGENLRAYRKAVGLTQRQLAEAGDVDFTYICKIESGQQPPPSTETLAKLGEALGVRLIHLEMLTRRVPHPLREKARDGSPTFRLLISLLSLKDISDEQAAEMIKVIAPVPGLSDYVRRQQR